MIPIITREDWGASHGTGALDPGPERRVVIHNSYKPALSPDATIAEEVAAVAAIERYHATVKEWDGIGYNFLFAPSGRVYEGRGWKFRGAHAGPVNGDSIGMCLLIDGETTEPTEAMTRSVREVIKMGVDLGELSPNYLISGHRDHMPGRTCPGSKVYVNLVAFYPEPEVEVDLVGDDVHWDLVDDLGAPTVVKMWGAPVSRVAAPDETVGALFKRTATVVMGSPEARAVLGTVRSALLGVALRWIEKTLDELVPRP